MCVCVCVRATKVVNPKTGLEVPGRDPLLAITCFAQFLRPRAPFFPSIFGSLPLSEKA